MIFFVCCSILACKKTEITEPIQSLPNTNTTNNGGLFNFPGIHVKNDAIYGTYLCIDSLESLHYLEQHLRNKPDHFRRIWESSIGFYSRETTIQNRMTLLSDSLKVLEKDLESNDELYYELWTEYRQLQYIKDMTAEFDKLVNDKGYVMFQGQIWFIRDTISYLVHTNGYNQPFHTFMYRHSDPCYQSKMSQSLYQNYYDTSSIQYDSCYDRRVVARVINYKNCWGYSYCKVTIAQDYVLCNVGRWLPFEASKLRCNIDITYEIGADTYHPDNHSGIVQGSHALAYIIDSGQGNICITDAYIECSASNNTISPQKIECDFSL